jgi:hypothetical protein
VKLIWLPLALPLLFLPASCASHGPYYYHPDDPFSEQLDLSYNRQAKHKRNLFIAALCFTGGFLLASYFSTAHSMDFGEPWFNRTGQSIAYGGAVAAVGVGVFSFIRWSKYTDEYLTTLRLQTQYYNILRP